jgi:PIN domain nuclease of toxin-antitoxin system
VIVLDTHAWVWWLANPRLLSRNAAKAIAEHQASDSVVISCFSTCELATLVARGRVGFSLSLSDWMRESEAQQGVRFHAVTNLIALDSVALPGVFHADPADRIIVATARKLGAQLVTRDEKIRSYRHVKTLW